jgi:hypothetical protein
MEGVVAQPEGLCVEQPHWVFWRGCCGSLARQATEAATGATFCKPSPHKMVRISLRGSEFQILDNTHSSTLATISVALPLRALQQGAVTKQQGGAIWRIRSDNAAEKAGSYSRRWKIE